MRFWSPGKTLWLSDVLYMHSLMVVLLKKRSYRVFGFSSFIPVAVVAFPCGSRSMSKTLLLVAARLEARFTAVVVFPTPPFWFAIAITLFPFFYL